MFTRMISWVMCRSGLHQLGNGPLVFKDQEIIGKCKCCGVRFEL